jgi:rhodanese-related sulfurtransferase
VTQAGDITVGELKRRLDQGEPLAILDVREPWEWDICRIPDSLFIPLNRLPGSLENLPKDSPLVVLCHHGVRSRMAVDWLQANGVKQVLNLAGGIDAWARQIDCQMKVY